MPDANASAGLAFESAVTVAQTAVFPGKSQHHVG
jgi:hypothetical protein